MLAGELEEDWGWSRKKEG